jgi:glyoxylase-like metal-dependent hydrolase (beta-lactamase superfamily II)
MKIIKDKFHIITVGDLEVNCVVAKCPVTSKAVIFDPGEDADKIIELIRSINAEPHSIVNTHCHYDHIGAVDRLRKEFRIPFLVHELEKEYSVDPSKNYSGMSGKGYSIKPDGTFKDGDILKAGNMEFLVIHTPGHTLGGCCFLHDGVLISGDTLFAGTIGRTDLYGGDTDTLIRSVREKLAVLDVQTIVIPGHERTTRIKDEKWFNPYLQS